MEYEDEFDSIIEDEEEEEEKDDSDNNEEEDFDVDKYLAMDAEEADALYENFMAELAEMKAVKEEDVGEKEKEEAA